jgi:hypothetical protein
LIPVNHFLNQNELRLESLDSSEAELFFEVYCFTLATLKVSQLGLPVTLGVAKGINQWHLIDGN